MKIQKEKLLLNTAYTSFGLASFFFFFYLRFPFDILERRALDIVEAKSDCVVVVGQSGLAFPAKISGSDIKASCPNKWSGTGMKERLEFKITALDLSLSPLALLFKRQGEIDFQVGVGGGTLKGQLTIDQHEEGLVFALNAFDGKQLNLAELGVGAGTAGLLAFQGEGRWSAQDLLKSTARLSFILEKGVFKEIGGWAIPVGEVSFSKIDGRLFWKGNRIVMEQFSANGEMADLQSEIGNLLLRSPLESSLLTLSLRARPKGSLKEMASLFVQGFTGREPLKIRANGPLGTLQLSVNGRSVRLES